MHREWAAWRETPLGSKGFCCQVSAGVTELAHPSRLHQTASSTGCSAESRAVITRLPPASLLAAQPGTALPGSVSSCCEPRSSPTCPGAVGQLLTQHMSPALSQGHTSPRQAQVSLHSPAPGTPRAANAASGSAWCSCTTDRAAAEGLPSSRKAKPTVIPHIP